MPRFGEAHKLLSPTHPDTERPAAGADPDDGQVPTWRTALKAWTAQDPAAGGVTDHGLLTGLGDDDHPQYPLLAGRAGGQTLIGGTGSGEHLTLQSTAHATRGYVRAQDDLQLLSNILRDSGGSNRLQLATTSPHLVATGDMRVNGGLGIACTPPATDYLRVEPSGVNLTNKVLARIQAASATLGSGIMRALTGVVPCSISSGAAAQMRGLEFAVLAVAGQGGATVDMRCIYNQGQVISFTGTVAKLVNLWGRQPTVIGGSPTVSLVRGIYLENQGGFTPIVDVESIKVEDITLNTGYRRLIELGPATPYFRVVGGAPPAAGLSNMRLNVGGTLYNVRTRTLNGYDCLTIN